MIIIISNNSSNNNNNNNNNNNSNNDVIDKYNDYYQYNDNDNIFCLPSAVLIYSIDRAEQMPDTNISNES